jgi:hypothetical protein
MEAERYAEKAREKEIRREREREMRTVVSLYLSIFDSFVKKEPRPPTAAAIVTPQTRSEIPIGSLGSVDLPKRDGEEDNEKVRLLPRHYSLMTSSLKA